MAEAVKVKAEVVGDKKKGSAERLKEKVFRFLVKLKLAVAIFLDAVDIVLANIPIVNTLWDFVTFMVLLVILKNKWLAFGAMAELPLVGLPFFGQIDAVLPIATLLTLIDTAETRFSVMGRFE